MKTIIASGPVIIQDGRLLVSWDDKDNFYKIPGGRVKEGESLEQTCLREAKEELGSEIEIIRPLHPLILYENPQTHEKMTIVLIHYLARLKNPNSLRGNYKWINTYEIKEGEHKVAPNIKYLLEIGDLEQNA